MRVRCVPIDVVRERDCLSFHLRETNLDITLHYMNVTVSACRTCSSLSVAQGRVTGAAWRVALLIICPAVAAAQEPGWSGAAEASANVLFGAARGRVVALKAGAERADSALEMNGDVLLTYADAIGDDDETREVTARSLRLSLGADYRPFARWSPFWFGAVESSLQQRLDRRYSTGAGAKLTFYRRGDDEGSVSLAVLWERALARDPAPPVPRATTDARWSLRVRLERHLTDAMRFEHLTFYQPTVDEIAEYIAETTTSIVLAVNVRLAVTATLRDRYDSEARARGARSNHDGQLLFGARAAF
jgi:hypothetical protein